MSHETIFRNILQKLNKCFMRYYRREWPDELAHNEFTPCCTEDQMSVLIRAYEICKQHNPMNSDVDIIKAILIYYYSTIVLEYYVLEDADKGGCFHKITNSSVKNLISQITSSNEEWASVLRRLLMGLDLSSGGRRRRRRNKKSRSSKRKRSARRTRKRTY